MRVTELSPLGWPYSSVGGFPPEILICENGIITFLLCTRVCEVVPGYCKNASDERAGHTWETPGLMAEWPRVPLRLTNSCSVCTRSVPNQGGIRAGKSCDYRGTSLIRNCLLLGPYVRDHDWGPTVVVWKWQFLMSKAPLQSTRGGGRSHRPQASSTRCSCVSGLGCRVSGNTFHIRSGFTCTGERE